MKILITGASAGIGWHTALQLLSEGHEVLLTARRTDLMREKLQPFPFADRARVAHLDVADEASVAAFFASHADWLGDVDVLVNNAGLALGLEPLADLPLEDIQRMLDTNVLGLLQITRRIIPRMKIRKTGTIINLGSVAGRQAYPNGTVYCATKAAVHIITEVLRLDLGGTNIRVTTLAPGKVGDTEFSEVRFRGDKAKADANYVGYRPLKPQDIAEAISWVIRMPQHMTIQEMIIMPTDQPSANHLVPFKS